MSEKVTVLYVDDEPINLLLFKTMFRTKYEVITTESGMAGLDYLAQHPEIKIVVSDMRMPIMNGLEFIKKAKELYPNIIFCILTGFEITDEIIEALDSKLIYRYFQKPFKMAEIDSAISIAIQIINAN